MCEKWAKIEFGAKNRVPRGTSPEHNRGQGPLDARGVVGGQVVAVPADRTVVDGAGAAQAVGDRAVEALRRVSAKGLNHTS